MTGLLRTVRFRRDHRWTPSHLSAFLDDELGADQRRRVARHTEDCPECRGVLQSLRRLLDALRFGPPPEPVAQRLVLRFRETLSDERGE
jgi:anti-sigma factor RsiW